MQAIAAKSALEWILEMGLMHSAKVGSMTEHNDRTKTKGMFYISYLEV